MYSFSIRQFIWEYIGDFFFVFGKFPLCNRFQLGNSFGNTLVFFLESSRMYSFSFRQFIWEYIGDFYDS